MERYKRVDFLVRNINDFDGDNLSLKTVTEIKSLISVLSLIESKAVYEHLTSPEYCEFRMCVKARILGFVRA